jgi:hypothetical protein
MKFLLYGLLMAGFIGMSLSLAGCASDGEGRYDGGDYAGDWRSGGPFSRGHTSGGTARMNKEPTADILGGGL